MQLIVFAKYLVLCDIKAVLYSSDKILTFTSIREQVSRNKNQVARTQEQVIRWQKIFLTQNIARLTQNIASIKNNRASYQISMANDRIYVSSIRKIIKIHQHISASVTKSRAYCQHNKASLGQDSVTFKQVSNNYKDIADF